MKSNGRWRARQLRKVGYSESTLPIIMLYNEICVPHGFWSITAFSYELEKMLLDHCSSSQFTPEEDLKEYRSMFLDAVNERYGGGSSYNTPRGAKLIRILWNNY